jgi:acetyl esterase/lipase
VTHQPFSYEPIEVPGSSTPILLATNIVFGRGGQIDLKLDLYRSDTAAASPLPIVVFIHGGGWHGGEKESYRDPALRVASHGYLCASIDYRLSGEAPFPAALEDCKCAVRWLRAHAADCGGDPEHVAAWGHSAGGHLAAMVALTPGRFEGDGGWPGFSSAIRCALCYSTPYDLAALEQHLGIALTQFLADGGTERASPMTYVSPAAVPFLICHGDQDDLVPVEQSDRFVAAMRAAGAPAKYTRLRGAGHDLSPFHEAIVVEAVRFLDGTLKHSSA